MNVCHTVFHEMPPVASWEEFAGRFPGIAHLLNAQQKLGLRLSWIAPSDAERVFCNDTIKVRFVRAPKQRRNVGWTQARRVAHAIAEENPQVIHQHGLNSWRALRSLNKLVRDRGIHCIVQDHGGGIPSSGIRQRLYRKSLATVGSAVFGDSGTRDLWVAGHLLAQEQCQILFAASSTFAPADEAERNQLRSQLKMDGKPILGWVAHLDLNKDPLTILQASAVYFEQNPEARLYMHFIKEDLRHACEALIAGHPILRERVFLRGRLPDAELEAFYRCIDYFVQGSHHEAYGYSVVEAMSAGAIPIVTDIPSFRLLCDSGRCGFLFPPADSSRLQEILAMLPQTAPSAERLRMVRRFESEFSYTVIAERLLALYTDSLAGKLPCG
jgi:glycosyltransferase involved in cell wall biosynthesis